MKQLKQIFLSRMTLSTIFFFTSVWVFQSYADLPAIIRGQVVKFDKNTVTLSQRNGQVKVEVPRSSIPGHYELKPGNAVQAELDGASVVKQMKAHAREEKGRQAKLKKAIQVASRKGQKSKLRRLKKEESKPKTVKFE